MFCLGGDVSSRLRLPAYELHGWLDKGFTLGKCVAQNTTGQERNDVGQASSVTTSSTQNSGYTESQTTAKTHATLIGNVLELASTAVSIIFVQHVAFQSRFPPCIARDEKRVPDGTGEQRRAGGGVTTRGDKDAGRRAER